MEKGNVGNKSKNLWSKIRRNGHFKKYKRNFISQISRQESEPNVHSVPIWMHNYSLTTSNNPRNEEICIEADFSHDNDTILECDNTEEVHGLGYDSSDNASEEVNHISESLQFIRELRTWALKYQIRHNALNSLIDLLQNHFPHMNLPNDVRTILQTPRKCLLTSINSHDHYWHYGLKKALIVALKNHSQTNNQLSLNVNIDGLPMFRSSISSFWPILIQIEEMKNEIPPLVVGIYCGKSKQIKTPIALNQN